MSLSSSAGPHPIEEIWRSIDRGDHESARRMLATLEAPISPPILCEWHLLHAHLNLLGNAAEEAEREATIALGVALDGGRTAEIIRAHNCLAQACRLRGERTRALEEFTRALEAGAPGDREARVPPRGRLLLQAAGLAGVLGRFDEADEHLQLAESSGVTPYQVTAVRLANALRARRFDRVPELLRQLDRQSRAVPPERVAHLHFCRAISAMEIQRFEESIDWFRRSIEACADHPLNTQIPLEARGYVAECRRRGGECSDTLAEELDALIATLQGQLRRGLLADLHRNKAALLWMRGEERQAEACFERAYQLATAGEYPLVHLGILLEHGWLLLGEPEASGGRGTARTAAILDRAGELAGALGHPPFLWHVRALRAVAAARQGAAEGREILAECRRDLARAADRDELSSHDLQLLDQRLQRHDRLAAERLRAQLAHDSAVMEEVIRGLRSEDSHAHMAAFATTIGEQLHAERLVMVLPRIQPVDTTPADGAAPGPPEQAPGAFDLIVARGFSEQAALRLADRLLRSRLLQPALPILVRDTLDPRDPAAALICGRDPAQPTGAPVDGFRRSNSAVACAISGALLPPGILYLDRPRDGGRPFQAGELRAFAFLANGLAAVSRRSTHQLNEENRRLRDRLTAVTRIGSLVTRSPRMRAILEQIRALRQSDLPVLIRGESGTGKELVARAVHEQSVRCQGPFVAVNCAAIPRDLLESELFGHARGAFTGALREKRGFFAEAEGGTIFLDEIAELPAATQAKLLRILDDHMVTPLGHTRGHRVDFRVVAATNADLEAAVATGSFRTDLYYRLQGAEFCLPPLRERREDLPLLVERFLGDFCAARGIGEPLHLSTEAWVMVERYAWPGNVRELRNAMLMAAEFRLVESATIPLRALPAQIRASGDAATAWETSLGEADRPVPTTGTASPERSADHAETLPPPLLAQLYSAITAQGYRRVKEALERYALHRALAESGGNQRAAARALGMRDSTLRTKLRRL
jgi:transcriptional regulator with GAF, ATPase, and Fis domain/tetratricopeptide (TPR) repeat protein